ncbi:hypothetical protein J437_LFUL013405 [Ladona fulva]|uniref:Uncharacterized protein n=1 Tax=Ladona fulva TaxID=123851 RepID=A0A8K0KG66_LADFU|nr:hypothetical protein J437_LFUL013405 [Ladona fulva]
MVIETKILLFSKPLNAIVCMTFFTVIFVSLFVIFTASFLMFYSIMEMYRMKSSLNILYTVNGVFNIDNVNNC